VYRNEKKRILRCLFIFIIFFVLKKRRENVGKVLFFKTSFVPFPQLTMSTLLSFSFFWGFVQLLLFCCPL